MISMLNQDSNLLTTINSVKELSNLSVHKDNGLFERLAEKVPGVEAIYFEGGSLLVDDYSNMSFQDDIYRLVELLEQNDKVVRRIYIAKVDEVKSLRKERHVNNSIISKDYDQEATLKQFQSLMSRALNLNAEDVYISLSQSQDSAFALFKSESALLPMQYPLKDYAFGRSMCAAVYDGLGGIGATPGTFDEVTTPQEKQINYNVYDSRGGIRKRLNIRFTKTKTSRPGELLIDLRIQQNAKKLEELGMEDSVLKIIRKKTSKTQGMIITAGRTGSGKTTSNFAILLDLPKEKIYQTFEDPIELEKPAGYPNIYQNSFDMKLGVLGQAKSILRQTPDGIFVQEIRDRETAEFAVQSCNTGLLVVASTHAPSAMMIPKRLNDLGISFSDMATPQGLSLLSYQVLARMLCPNCKISLKHAEVLFPTALEKRLAAYNDLYMTPNIQLHFMAKPNGCEKCNHTGERGRQLVVEVIDVDRESRKFILVQNWAGWAEYLDSTGFISISKKIQTLVANGLVDVLRAAEIQVEDSGA